MTRALASRGDLWIANHLIQAHRNSIFIPEPVLMKALNMRRSAIAAALLLIAGTGQAQFIEVADQRSADVAYGNILPFGDNWVIGAWANPEWGLPGPMHYITSLDQSGQELLWRNVPMGLTEAADFSSSGDLISSDDGGILLVGPWDQCDISDSTRLIHITADGIVDLNRNIADGSYGGLTTFAKAHTSRLAMFGHQMAIVTDLLGNAQFTWPIPFSTAHHAIWTSDTTLMLAVNNRLMHVGMDGTPLDSVFVTNTIRDIALYNGELLALTDYELLKLPVDLSDVMISTYTTGAGTRRFITGAEDIHFQVANSLWRWDDVNGIVLVVQPELLPGQRIISMALRADTLHTTSIVDVHGYRTGLYRTYALNGTTTLQNDDVRVDGISLDSTWFTYHGPAGNVELYYTWANAIVSLTNLSDTPLNEIVVCHRNSGPGMCGDPTTMIIHSEPIVLPGESFTVRMENLALDYGPSFPGDFFSGTICATALSPNQKVDRQPEDNHWCGEFTFMNTVGVNDHLYEQPFEVHPNPFTDRINLELGRFTGRIDVQLFDLQGRKIHSASFPGVQNNVTMELPEMADAIYILTVQGDDMVSTRRIVRSAR